MQQSPEVAAYGEEAAGLRLRPQQLRRLRERLIQGPQAGIGEAIPLLLVVEVQPRDVPEEAAGQDRAAGERIEDHLLGLLVGQPGLLHTLDVDVASRPGPGMRL